MLVETDSAYSRAIQAAVGRQLLDEEGAGDVKYSETVARGQAAYQDWIAENGVTFDPKFGVDLVDGKHGRPTPRCPSPSATPRSPARRRNPDPEYAQGLARLPALRLTAVNRTRATVSASSSR